MPLFGALKAIAHVAHHTHHAARAVHHVSHAAHTVHHSVHTAHHAAHHVSSAAFTPSSHHHHHDKTIHKLNTAKEVVKKAGKTYKRAEQVYGKLSRKY